MYSPMHFDHDSFYRLREEFHSDYSIEFTSITVKTAFPGVSWYLVGENRWNGKKYCDAKFSVVACCEPTEIDKDYNFAYKIETSSPSYRCERSFFPMQEMYTQKFIQFKSETGATCSFQEVIKKVSPLDIKVKVIVRSKKPFPTIVKLFDDIASPDLVDFTIKVDDEEFKTHKFILSARSPIFRRMFLSDFAESNDSTMKIDDISKHIFKIFLEFLYTGQIEKHPVSSLMDLLKVADKYGVESLKTSCDDLILCKLKLSDPVHEVYQYAHACNCTQGLKEKAFELLKQKYFESKTLPDRLLDYPGRVEQLVRMMEEFDTRLSEFNH